MHPHDPARRCQEALDLIESGRKKEAEAKLRALLAEGARLPRACMALGVLCGERGDLAERRLWFQQARGLEEASGQPISLRLLLNLQVDALEQGEPERSLAFGEEASALYPEEGEVPLQQGQVLKALKRLGEARQQLERARAAFRELVRTEPDNPKPWRLLAAAESQLERPDAAIEAYGQAVALEPDHIGTLLALSRLLVNRGSVDQALPWLMNALAVAPDDPDVLHCNAIALMALGEPQQAINLFRQALALQPSMVRASVALAIALNNLGLFAEGAEVARQALSYNSNSIDARLILGVNLRSMGDSGSALAIFADVLADVPDSQSAFNQWMFTTSISLLVPPAEVLATARRFWALPERRETEQRGPSIPPARGNGQPMRVGLLSADIGNHVVSMFLDPLLRHHDFRRCHLELISMQRRYESGSEAMIAMADGVLSLEGMPPSEARAVLKERRYDLIVDTSGYTRGTGLPLLAERCAPLQAHYIGYHATTGLASIDGFIGDEETAAAELQDQFSERLWRLPRPWLAYPSPESFPQAAARPQSDAPVLGCFGQLGKISDSTLDIWAEVLHRLPEALLVLKDKGLQDEACRKHLGERLVARGVALSRVTLLAPAEQWTAHVELYNSIDIALDTTPWSSATTGFEALAMGVPLVAIRGNRLAARMGSSLVKGLGRHEWIGDSSESVAEAAARLCADLPELRQGKARRQQEALTSCLFDGADLAEKLTHLFAAVAVPQNQPQP
ncbi:MAG: tetratricopeptide repeat protein [Synechococcaceae cyanobacterium]|nr:tetratricopeptide repeat protein [Synechococcaceae cyanobacterium]